MLLKIYTYKITFEEIPHFYYGVHKESKQNDGYLGSPVTHKWMWDFYTPQIQILELFDFSEEGWKKAKTVENRIIQEFLNHPLCLNEACGGSFSLESQRRAGKVGGIARSKEKLTDGKSAVAVEK